jgi:hypothetical protein
MPDDEQPADEDETISPEVPADLIELHELIELRDAGAGR